MKSNKIAHHLAKRMKELLRGPVVVAGLVNHVEKEKLSRTLVESRTVIYVRISGDLILDIATA